MKAIPYRFCPLCASPLGETLGHYQTCAHCGFVYFPRTPQTAAALLINKMNEVLLVQRNKDPFRGRWSLPAGFVEFGENPIDTALRELHEETGIVANAQKVVGVFLVDDHPDVSSVLTIVSVDNPRGMLAPADDAADIGFFSIHSLPSLAFTSHRAVILDRQGLLR